jgi:hypothetical protein
MTEDQIGLLLSLTHDEARLVLDQNEYALYRTMQKMLIKLAREYEVQLPLNCLQFMYCGNRHHGPNFS